MSGIADFLGEDFEVDGLDLKVMNVEYVDTDAGPVIHIFGRDRAANWHHVEVEGHYPSFYIHEEEHNQRVDNHYAVKETETHDENGERYVDLHGNPLVRVYTYQPSQVADMRDLFEETFEADVFYTKRWLIDNGIKTGVRIYTSDAITDGYVRGEFRVDIEACKPLDIDATPGVEPRQVVLDIEVAGEEGVPDESKAEWPISTIVAWDSHDEEYIGWILESDEWDEETREEMWESTTVTGDAELTKSKLFDDESKMLHDFHEWVESKRPDIITGWYSNDFDIPYLVNRSRNLNTYNYQDWSPLGEVFIAKYDPVVKGVSCVDMLEAYKKTKIHKLKKKGLDDVAADTLDESKVELDRSHTEMWKEEPVEFLRYNKRDVELVHRIDEEAGCTELLDNLRAVVGCSYSDPIGGNIDMMDVLFLRKAKEYGRVLPTAEKPAVGDYHGAYVYTPDAGLHEHILYPDYSSLYPNIMYQCNISPETLIGTKEDLEASEYTEDEAVWTHIDTVTPPPMKEDKEAEDGDLEKLYFVDPSIEEGFIRSVLDDIMGLASQYSGGMYEAVKRVRNSTYGVLGDSDSYGRGFRLFDWRLAEGTTLGGQEILREGGRKFVEYIDDDDAYIVYGDTDSYVTAVPNADDGHDALRMGFDAAEELNEYLNDYAADAFGLDSVDDARMEVEIESYASAIFFKGKNGGRSDDGVKKRYVQLEEWNDSLEACVSHDDPVHRCEQCRKSGWLDEPDLEIKGFEYVRSDVADVTATLQKSLFDSLLRLDEDEAEESAKALVSDTITDVMESETGRDSPYSGLGDLGIPFGIGQALSKYGDETKSAQAQYAGAKYANKEIYGGDAITPGDKPLYFYIEQGKTGPLRKTYDSHTGEDGQYVHCISVLDADDLPNEVRIDREKMVQKTIIDPLKEIFRTLGWGVGWMEDAVEDAKSPEMYRDEGQRGFEDFEGSTKAHKFM